MPVGLVTDLQSRGEICLVGDVVALLEGVILSIRAFAEASPSDALSVLEVAPALV